MNKAVFLDRDGVINIERGQYTYLISDFEFVEGIFENLKKLSDAGFLLIVISNQGGIEKEYYDYKDVEKLHEFMKVEFKKHGISCKEIYYCPHHSDFQKCLCRKPGSLLIEKAIARFQIDPARSYMIGDQKRDETAGKKAGVTGFLVERNHNISEIIQKILDN